MKKLAFLIALSLCAASVAKANNETKSGEPEPKRPEQYTFSLTKAYFALFNLFTVEPQEKDSLQIKAPKPKLKEEEEFLFFPIGM
ncbi:MAG: hypothetical protein RL226_671 [Bacteroidota bacterium]